MKQYKLIHNTIKEETICSLVTIGGFNYYVSDEIKKEFPHWCIQYTIDGRKATNLVKVIESNHLRKSILATNNPNIDIPKIFDGDKTKDDWSNKFKQ